MNIVTVKGLAGKARRSMLGNRDAASCIGRAENWCRRLVAECFGDETLSALDLMSAEDLAALNAAATSFFRGLFTEEDESREAWSKAAESGLDSGDTDSEALNQGEVILNLTPHAVVVVDDNGNKIAEFAPEATPARLSTKTEKTGEFIAGIPVTKTVFGEPVNLPEQRPNTFLIVSALFKSALPHRADLLIPNETVRDADGKIVGCKSFA